MSFPFGSLRNARHIYQVDILSLLTIDKRR
jgi:hypothetical protein